MILFITDEIRKRIPYTCAYAELHGKRVAEDSFEVDLISTFETPSKYENKPELLYKECIESGKKWTEIVSKVNEKVIL